MKSLWKKFAAAGLTAAMGVSMLAGCGNKDAKIDGTKTAVTINDEAVSLGAVSFQARFQQAYMYQMYSQYFGTTQIFDQVMDESTEKTYGDQIKESVLENIEELVLIKQHAADYDVALDDEKKAEIEKIAQAYIDENDEKVRAQIGASKEDVVYLLELQTIQDMMREPMAKDVDTEVSDDEAQQTTVTYLSLAKKTEEDLAADESAADESVSDESLSDESVSEEAKAAQLEEANKEVKENAEKILADLKASDNAAEADMTAIAAKYDDTLTAASGQFTTNDPTDTTLDASVVEAVADLKDGEVCDKVIETDTHYYVVRVDKTFAKDETEAKKEQIVKDRKTEAYNNLIDTWKKEADIKVDDKVMATLLITDSAPFTLGQDESVADVSTADESLADETTADSAAAEVADSSVTDESVADESVADESAADSSTDK
jgi:trigger factor/foldase protein PrsA